MHGTSAAYVVSLMIAGGMSAVLAGCAWRRRAAPGAAPLAWFMLAVAEWLVGYAFELGSADLPAKLLWAKLEYLGIVSVAPMGLVLALCYTGREQWLGRRATVILALMPIVTLLLVWTNEYHGLIWRTIRLDTSGAITMLDVTYGAWFWVHTGGAYLLLLLYTVVLFQTLVRAPNRYRGQAGILLIGALAPWLGNAVYIAGISPFPHLDLTPFAFMLTGLAAAGGIVRYQLFDLAPIARDAVTESLRDGVLVLDEQHRIVDLNPAAARIIGASSAVAIGQPIGQVVADWPDLVERSRDLAEIFEEITLRRGGVQRSFELHVSSLYHRHGHRIGRVLVLHDITARQHAELALRESEARYRQLVERSPDLIGIHYRGELIYVNSAGANLLGAEAPEEVIGKPTMMFVHPAYRETVQARVCQTQVGRQAVDTIEEQFVRLDGQVIDVEVAAIPVTYCGQPATQVIARDISERKRAEAALRASEERARALSAAAQRQAQELALLDQVRTALMRELELPVLFRTVVEAIAATFGYTQVSLYLLQEEVLHLQHQVGYDRVIAQVPIAQGVMGRSIRTGQPILLEDARADPAFLGAIEGIRSEICVPLIDQSQAVGVLNVESIQGVRLTEADLRLMLALGEHINLALGRARIFTEMRESEARYRSVITALSEGVVLQAADGHILACNASAERILGLSTDQIVERAARDSHWQAIYEDGSPFPGETHPAIVTLHTGVPQSGVVMGVHKLDGSLVWLSINTQPLFRSDEPAPYAVVTSFSDITERKRMEEALRNQALRDPLTGLFNRRYLEEALERELRRSLRSETPMGVIMADLDHFKRVNDIFGHSAGDAVLREVGLFLQTHVREEDIACRYGGEEFTLILPGASLGETVRRAEELCARVKELHVRHDGQTIGTVTLSLGVAAAPTHGMTVETLVEATDTALYCAKATGRDQVVIAR